jgi:ABC-2 type transport system ATP-binding protein
MALFGRLTATEYLRFVGRMYGLDAAPPPAHRRAARIHGPRRRAEKAHHRLLPRHAEKLALAAAVIHGPKVLFLDEPFEGVDAIAAGTLKNMLQGMIARGATIFLTSHVLEIVERLCSHIAIIDRGHLVAQGSLDELRAGVQARLTPDGESTAPSATLTLEQIFLNVVGSAEGAASHSSQELNWLS